MNTTIAPPPAPDEDPQPRRGKGGHRTPPVPPVPNDKDEATADEATENSEVAENSEATAREDGDEEPRRPHPRPRPRPGPLDTETRRLLAAEKMVNEAFKDQFAAQSEVEQECSALSAYAQEVALSFAALTDAGMTKPQAANIIHVLSERVLLARYPPPPPPDPTDW